MSAYSSGLTTWTAVRIVAKPAPEYSVERPWKVPVSSAVKLIVFSSPGTASAARARAGTCQRCITSIEPTSRVIGVSTGT
jgi:hypothetical protein